MENVTEILEKSKAENRKIQINEIKLKEDYKILLEEYKKKMEEIENLKTQNELLQRPIQFSSDETVGKSIQNENIKMQYPQNADTSEKIENNAINKELHEYLQKLETRLDVKLQNVTFNFNKQLTAIKIYTTSKKNTKRKNIQPLNLDTLVADVSTPTEKDQGSLNTPILGNVIDASGGERLKHQNSNKNGKKQKLNVNKVKISNQHNANDKHKIASPATIQNTYHHQLGTAQREKNEGNN
ncbi:hypothetical protein WA026_014107 [Henosepilachna vigintioctopunctata]|uniref:Uncharacterized protein n=1 Tax=Henosepilachna vigintioctopunctata TaxID=420089 RepID=A0AAW1TTG7_9CUCU